VCSATRLAIESRPTGAVCASAAAAGSPRSSRGSVRSAATTVGPERPRQVRHADAISPTLALHRLEDASYSSVLADPLLKPLFGEGQPEHVDHLTAFTAESFGGPDRFTRELGFGHLIAVHRHLTITEDQRRRFVELYMAALDEAGMPDDEPFCEAVRSHVEFGSRVAMQNSNAETDDELHPLRDVPRWTWPGDD
jgi:hemoglobin